MTEQISGYISKVTQTLFLVSATDRLLQTGPSLTTDVHYRDKGHVGPAQSK